MGIDGSQVKNIKVKTPLQKRIDKIANQTGDDRFFTKKELAYLPEILTPDEEVLAFASGLMDGNTWLITLTDKRIIFLDKGMLYGLKQSIIDLDKVNTISCSTRMIFGTISIQDGANSRVIENVLKYTVKPFTNKVQEAIDKRKNSQQIAATPAKEDDMYAQLEKLADLKARGILTDEEFTQQKTKLLA